MHPDYASSLNNVGSIFDRKGEYDKALEYYFKSLEIKKVVLGKMHPGYASSLNNIGSTYDRKGEYDKALEYYFKSLEIKKIVLG
jgi:nephrocystin-3